MESNEPFNNLPFEDAMRELEAIVASLNAGEGTLDDSVALFQRGILLSRYCASKLEETEQKIRILTDPEKNTETDFSLSQTETER